VYTIGDMNAVSINNIIEWNSIRLKINK
jgi:hypothetical protein